MCQALFQALEIWTTTDNVLDLLELWFQSRGTVALTHWVCHPGESQQTSLERRKGSFRRSQSGLLPLTSSPGYSQGSHRPEQDSPARPQGPATTRNASPAKEALVSAESLCAFPVF